MKLGPFSYAAIPALFLSAANSIGSSAAATNNRAPPHPGLISLDPKFRVGLKCPHADSWLAKGPEQAARELGLLDLDIEDSHGSRRLMEVKGSCGYSNPWSGETCLQFEGAGWTADGMASRCDEEGGEWSAQGCTEHTAGWCTKTIAEGKREATAMVLSAMADCGGSEMACASFMGGIFVAAGECLGDDNSASEDDGNNIFGASSGAGGPPPGVMSGGAGGAGGPKCLIAPGAIGAAHQAGFSKGYSSSCPGTPAQESPYMWPMKWAADYDNRAMVYGSDDVVYNSRGRTFYMLDRNWKRSDTVHQEGVLRAIVTGGPCDNLDSDEDGITGCYKNQTDGTMWTMLHLENMMYFVDWKEDADVSPGELDATKIANCTELDMAVVGNIRPDWFLDARGDDTDVQYLGDQHVYYADGELPKLVKQWRKKDFASQYFTMSMMENTPNKLAKNENAPAEDDIHWPLILNVPGEGFGDDSLQVYKNHALLNDDDHMEIFQLVENFKAMGGVCVSGRGGGPPSGEGTDDSERPHIPSNLEVDPLSWRTNEITMSPIWVVPTKDDSSVGSSEPVPMSGKAVLEVSDRITVESCYDESTKMMDMSVHFKGIEPSSDGLLPWMAIGYRPSDVCAMTPREGGSTPIVLVTQLTEDAAPEAHKTELLPSAKSGQGSAFASMYATMSPMDEEADYADVSVESADDEDMITLHFKQEVGETPDDMNMLFAIGMAPDLGYHTTRGCFQVKASPCSGGIAADLPGKGDDASELPAAAEGKAVLEVSDRLTVESCYDDAIDSMRVSAHFHDIEPTSDGLLPWMALGYLPSDTCMMTPPDGGVTPMVLMTQADAGASPEAHKTVLLPNTKSMDAMLFSSMMSLAKPLEGEADYTDVMVKAPMASTAAQVARSSSSFEAEDTVSLHFVQSMGDEPEVVNMMYAIGLKSELGVHVARGCFQVQPSPCGSARGESNANASDGDTTSQGIAIDLGEMEVDIIGAPSIRSSASMASSAGAFFAFSAIIAHVSVM